MGAGAEAFSWQTKLSILDQMCGVLGPGDVLCDVHTQELGAAHTYHSSIIDGQRGMLSVH